MSPSIDIYSDTRPSRPSSDSRQAPASVVPEADTPSLKALHRRVDRRLLIWYCFVYLIMRCHVGNVSNAAIMNIEQGTGIKKQLDLSGTQWAWVLSIFYYAYGPFEPLSTLALKRFSPSTWMTRIMITWGATSNYAGLLAVRFLLGMAEAGFYPGVLYHLSFWYHPEKLPLRIAFFYACGMFSGTISGLLAYAISFMNGLCGLAGWRWLFILEGIPAVLCGIVTWFILPDYPDTASFLTAAEKQVVLADLSADAPSNKARTWSWPQVKALLQDPSFVPFTLIWITHGIGGWGISFVLPTVIYQLGISDTAISQVMTMPPYTLVFVILLTLAFFIHKGTLSPWVAGLAVELVQIVCYVLLITVHSPRAKYVFVMVATAASQSFYPLIWPQRIRAARGTTAAGLAIGITNGVSCVSGIVGPQLYNSKFGPTYRVSYCTSIGILGGTVLCILWAWACVWRSDAKRAAAAAEAEEEQQDSSSETDRTDGKESDVASTTEKA